MRDLSFKAVAKGQYEEGLSDAIKIIEGRLPLYTDIGQINALRESISSIKGALERIGRGNRAAEAKLEEGNTDG